MDKKREVWHLSVFKKVFPDFPHGEIVEGEAPDFTVGTVAIELTELLIESGHKGSPLKESETREDCLIRRIHTLAHESGLPPLWISLHFGRHSAKSFDGEKLAAALCDVISLNIPATDECVVLTGKKLPSEISSLRVRRHSQNFAVAPTRAGFHVKLKPEFVLQRIRDKEGKIKGDHSQRWLLMVMEGFAPSSFWDTEVACACEYETTFDRVFLLDCFGGAYSELRTTKR